MTSPVRSDARSVLLVREHGAKHRATTFWPAVGEAWPTKEKL